MKRWFKNHAFWLILFVASIPLGVQAIADEEPFVAENWPYHVSALYLIFFGAYLVVSVPIRLLVWGGRKYAQAYGQIREIAKGDAPRRVKWGRSLLVALPWVLLSPVFYRLFKFVLGLTLGTIAAVALTIGGIIAALWVVGAFTDSD